MTKVEDELAFLVKFGKRFKKKTTYVAAVTDLFEEGLITRKAYKEFMRDKIDENVPIKPEKMAKKAVKVLKQTTDPCSRNVVFHSCEPVVKSSPCEHNNTRC